MQEHWLLLTVFAIKPYAPCSPLILPMDQAKGILSYIQVKHPDKGYGLDGVMSDLVRYNLRPETLPEEIVLTVRTISEISGKSIQTLHCTISLLILLPEIHAEIRLGNLPVSQGYLFAANLDCSELRNSL